MNLFSSIPFLRICLPYLAGILFAILTGLYTNLLLLLIILTPLIIIVAYRSPKTHKWLLMALADIFLFALAVSSVFASDVSKLSNYYGNVIANGVTQKFVAVVADLPVKKERSIKCVLQIFRVEDNDKGVDTRGTVLAYFRKSAAASYLREGQTILINSKFIEIPAPQNPYEFDYKAYLKRKQINHTIFVDSSSFEVVEHDMNLNPVWMFGLKCKRFLLDRLLNSPLSSQSYAICAALLTGYDDDIEKPVMDAFSHSGTLHVLSVSGLHTGLIYLALNFLLGTIDRRQKYKVLRFFIVTICLWSFALVTGFSAPVLRAVIMFNLLGFGKIYFRSNYRNQLNILLVSAFMLLCYDPWLITDVGFLLSYFALIGLIYFQPIIGDSWQPQNYFLRYGWISISASVAATLSTLPITLFVFKQFPLWFFVCNIVVVPATFALLILGIFVVLKIPFIATVINFIVTSLIEFINLFNKKDSGFIDNIHFGYIDALILSVLIVMVSAAFHYRSYFQLRISIIILLCWQIFSLTESFIVKQEDVFSVYQLKNKTAFSLKNDLNTYVSNVDSSAFAFNIKPHITSFNYVDVQTRDFNYIQKNSTAMLILNGNELLPDSVLASVNNLVICGNYKLTESDLRFFPRLKRLVIDGSNNRSIRNHTAQLSRKFAFELYDTKSNGAFILPLQ